MGQKYICTSCLLGPCAFDKISGHHGDSSSDFTMNDVTVPYVSDDACADLCLAQSSVIYASNLVTEECWGFTTTATECIVHVVVKPSFFSITSRYYVSAGSNFFKKRCFASKLLGFDYLCKYLLLRHSSR